MDLPQFEDEASEARWWFEHQDELAQEFAMAAAEGRLEQGSLERSAGLLLTTTLHLDPANVALAREQAKKRGLQYQNYSDALDPRGA